MKDSYHHENLKQELIDTGIRIFNAEGEKGLSLRKVAAACNVSHAAPYSHFSSKEELFEAMKNTVSELFASELRMNIDNEKDKDVEAQIVALGKGYVKFFLNHPDYYTFLFYGQKITVHLGAKDDYSGDYPPYKIFRDLLEQYFAEKEQAMSDREKEILLIKAWAVVQGLASLVCMENVSTSKPWEEYLDDIII